LARAAKVRAEDGPRDQKGAASSPGGADVPLQVVEPVRLYRQIAGQIATLIDNGEFAAGSRLPAERELAVLLGVSRTSVREALISLEIAGRVEVRVGTGIFVRRPAGASRGMPATGQVAAGAANGLDVGTGPFELLAARRLIEGEIAALAARRIRKGEIAALQDTIDRMHMHGDDFEQRDAADRAFHVAIAEATGNGSFALVVHALWEQRRGELWTRIEKHFHTTALREKTLADHAAIVAALAAHDSDAARAAMHRHLARVEREFQRKWDAIVPGTGPPGTRKRKPDPQRVS
jgi:GntR family transcriptional regulator, uxu operon transcriptional repressor